MAAAKGTTKGNCFICGKSFTKGVMLDHINEAHNGGEEQCVLLKAEGTFAKKYWLYLSLPGTSTLEDVDDFLRAIWCECCGHLSEFRQKVNHSPEAQFAKQIVALLGTRGMGGFGRMGGGMDNIDKDRRLSTFHDGDVLEYIYDFGTPTSISVTFIGDLSRKPRKEAVELIARNPPSSETCDECGKPATYIDYYNRTLFCDECCEKYEDEYGSESTLSPITNSPRVGCCGYVGSGDEWTFNSENYKK